MTNKIVSSFAVALTMLAGTAACANPEAASYAAACVAALKARESRMTQALKPGAPVEPELLQVVRGGIAIIGNQYLSGLRESEARHLLDAAERDFQALPTAAAETRQAQCLQEGDRLYKRASALERSLITTAAQRRIKRLRAN
ncbi:MAG: hypothetical protein M3Y55_02670 [Pseudomonadota bacterium]|nr:hypothetical protein [Pseudomonadota bacterium]